MKRSVFDDIVELRRNENKNVSTKFVSEQMQQVKDELQPVKEELQKSNGTFLANTIIAHYLVVI